MKQNKNCDFGRLLNKVHFLTNKSIFLWRIKMTRRITLNNKKNSWVNLTSISWCYGYTLGHKLWHCCEHSFIFFFQKFLLRLFSTAKRHMNARLEHSSSTSWINFSYLALFLVQRVLRDKCLLGWFNFSKSSHTSNTISAKL